MDKRISTQQLRANISETLNEIRRDKKVITITRRGLPIAELVPVGFRKQMVDEIKELRKLITGK